MAEFVVIEHEHCPKADRGKPCAICPSGEAEMFHPGRYCAKCWPCGCCMACTISPCADAARCPERCACALEEFDVDERD